MSSNEKEHKSSAKKHEIQMSYFLRPVKEVLANIISAYWVENQSASKIEVSRIQAKDITDKGFESCIPIKMRGLIARGSKVLTEIGQELDELHQEIANWHHPKKKSLLRYIRSLQDWDWDRFDVKVSKKTARDKKISLFPPIACFFEKKKTTLAKIHLIVRDMETRIIQLPDIELSLFETMSKAHKDALEKIQIQFSQYGLKYPGIRHTVMNWPFTSPAPHPPRDLLTKHSHHLVGNYYALPFRPSAFLKDDLLAWDWFWRPETIDLSPAVQNSLVALCAQAGDIINARLGIELGSLSHDIKNWALMQIWLKTVYAIRSPEIEHDGWDGLFDAEIDNIALKNRKYVKFSIDDVYLDSVATCEFLLNNSTDHQEAKNEWITVTQAAEKAKVDKGTITRWANEGKIHTNSKVDKDRRIDRVSLLLHLDNREDKKTQKKKNDYYKDVEILPDRR